METEEDKHFGLFCWWIKVNNFVCWEFFLMITFKRMIEDLLQFYDYSVIPVTLKVCNLLRHFWNYSHPLHKRKLVIKSSTVTWLTIVSILWHNLPLLMFSLFILSFLEPSWIIYCSGRITFFSGKKVFLGSVYPCDVFIALNRFLYASMQIILLKKQIIFPGKKCSPSASQNWVQVYCSVTSYLLDLLIPWWFF